MDGSEIPPWGQSELVQIVHDGGKLTSRWGNTSIISQWIPRFQRLWGAGFSGFFSGAGFSGCFSGAGFSGCFSGVGFSGCFSGGVTLWVEFAFTPPLPSIRVIYLPYI